MKILNNHIFKRKQAKNSAAKILNNSMFRRKQGQVLVGFGTELKGKQDTQKLCSQAQASQQLSSQNTQ